MINRNHLLSLDPTSLHLPSFSCSRWQQNFSKELSIFAVSNSFLSFLSYVLQSSLRLHHSREVASVRVTHGLHIYWLFSALNSLDPLAAVGKADVPPSWRLHLHLTSGNHSLLIPPPACTLLPNILRWFLLFSQTTVHHSVLILTSFLLFFSLTSFLNSFPQRTDPASGLKYHCHADNS